MIKAIGLLSGGLDSTIAVKLLLDQGIEVTAFNMVTPFCACTRKGCRHEASRVAAEFGIPIKVISGGREYIQMVKNPKHGYGRNMNPCIDCRIFMLKRAKDYMHEIGASFLFTGEVLGQRPMSQRFKAMELIEREAGLEGLILRPLSARFLPPTIPEKEGWVDRDALLALKGRSRRPQMELADSYAIRDYPCPAGGCRLTDPQFAKRVQEAFRHDEDSVLDMMLLRYGRHFRLASGAKVVVGRNEEENMLLKGLVGEDDLLLEPVRVPGPTAVLRNTAAPEDVDTAAALCARYSDAQSPPVQVKIWKRSGEPVTVSAPFAPPELQPL